MRTTREILIEDLSRIEDGMCRVSEDSEIWQNRLIYWMCCTIRHLLIYVIKGMK